jgi:hypothetical protein
MCHAAAPGHSVMHMFYFLCVAVGSTLVWYALQGGAICEHGGVNARVQHIHIASPLSMDPSHTSLSFRTCHMCEQLVLVRYLGSPSVRLP